MRGAVEVAELVRLLLEEVAQHRLSQKAAERDLQRRALREAVNTQNRQNAFGAAKDKQAKRALRRELQTLCECPLPPAVYACNPDDWNLIRVELKRRLDTLGGPLDE